MIKKHLKGKNLEEPFTYLAELEETLANKTVCLGSTPESYLDLEFLSKALKVKTSFIIKTVFTAYNESKDPEKEKANEIFAKEVNEMAKTHLIYVAFRTFVTRIREHKFRDANILPHMELIAKVFALHELTNDC